MKRNSNAIRALAVVASMAIGSAAQAAFVNIDQGGAGNGPEDNPQGGNPTLAIGDTGFLGPQNVSGSFIHSWYFDLSDSLSSIEGEVASFQFPSLLDITGLSAELFLCGNSNCSTSTSVASGTSFTLGSAAAGIYHLLIIGNGVGQLGGIYSAQLDVGTPVPLPAAGWLLLSGIVGLGAFARRRRGAGSLQAA